MNKFVIKILNTIYVITRPTKDFIFPHLARRLEKLPTPVVHGLWMCKWRRCARLVDEQVETLCMVVRCASGDVVHG